MAAIAGELQRADRASGGLFLNLSDYGGMEMEAARALGFVASVVLGGFVVTANAGQKELEAYKGGLGKWNCEAKELGSGKTFKSTIENTVEFDGHTYIEKYTEFKSADHPQPWSAVFLNT